MLDYFIFDYVNLTHGFIYLFGNYFIAAGIPFLFGESENTLPKRVLIRAFEVLACIVAMELFASVYYAIFRADTVVPFVCGFLLLVLYAVFRAKDRPAVRIVRASGYYAISSLALATTMSVGSLLGVPYYYLEPLLITVNGIVIFSAVFAVRNFSPSSDAHLPNAFVIAAAVSSLLCALFAILRRFFYIDPATSLAVCFILLFLYIILFFVMSRVILLQDERSRKLTRELLYDADRETFRRGQENLEALRRLRHELRNQYAIMKSLLDDGEYDKLQAYFAELGEKFESATDFFDCGNEALNAIFYIERERANRCGASLDCKIAVPPVLAIGAVDLSSLLMNLIDNALESLERNPTLSDRRVEVEAVQRDGHLFVRVANPLPAGQESSALTLKTCKENQSLHGYGSKVVAVIAKKYNGTVEYTAENGVFTACAVLFDPDDKKEAV